ncbi:MAG: hypothetical protein U0531_17350 [Dehalococcoidia bacterium]
MVFKLLRHRLRVWRTTTFRGSRAGRRTVGLMIGSLVGAALLSFVIVNSFAFTYALRLRNPALTEPFLGLMLTSMVMMLVFTMVGPILHQLYMAADLDLLLAAPVPIRGLFAVKLAEGMFVGELIGLMQIGAVAGYGLARREPPAFFLAAVPVLALLVLLVTALCMVGIMVFMRFIPIGRMRGLLTLAVTGFGTLIWLMFQAISPGRARDAAAGLEPVLHRFDQQAWWAPTTWAANTLLAVGRGRWVVAALNLALLAAVVTAAVAVAYAVFRYTFYVNQGRARDIAPRRTRARAGRLLPRLVRPLPPAMRAIIVKDARILVRDLRLLSGLIFPLVMFGFFSFRISGPDAGADGLPADAHFWRSLLPVLLIPFFFCGNLSLVAFGQEGRSFHVLRAAPVRMEVLVMAKFLVSFVLIGAVTVVVVLALGLAQGGSPGQVALALVMAAWLTAGAVLANIAVGALAPKFESDNPQRSVGFAGWLLGSLLSLLFLGASGALFGWPVLLALDAIEVTVATAVVVTTLLAAVVLGAVAVILGVLYLGVRRLEGWEV